MILTAHRDAAYVESALASGAAGFLFKQTSAQTLYHTIRAVHAGEREVGEMAAPRDPPSNRWQKRSSVTRLTPREAEVLQLIAEGKANKETARILAISAKTVEKHRSSLMQKLNLHDTAGITRYAIAAGVIESGSHVTIG